MPVQLLRSDAHGIGRDCLYQGLHLPFHQGPAAHTPRGECTGLVAFIGSVEEEEEEEEQEEGEEFIQNRARARRDF